MVMYVTTVIHTSAFYPHPHLTFIDFIRLLPVATSADPLITHSRET